MAELKVLFTREQIAQRVAEMGADINRDFAGQSVILLGVLKGAAIFLSDLAPPAGNRRHFRLHRRLQLRQPARALPRNCKSGWDSTGEVRLTKDVDQSMSGKNVILVEDILDTGLTLTFLKKLLMARQPKSLQIAALLDKPSRRKQPIQATTWASVFPTSSWSAMGWIMPRSTAIFRIFALCRGSRLTRLRSLRQRRRCRSLYRTQGTCPMYSAGRVASLWLLS